MLETIATRKFQLVVNTDCSMSWPIFAVGPALLIAAAMCSAALATSALAGPWAAAHFMIWTTIPRAIALLSGLDKQRLDRFRLVATVAAAGLALAAALFTADQSSPELQTLWFLLSVGTTAAVTAAHWPQRTDKRGEDYAIGVPGSGGR